VTTLAKDSPSSLCRAVQRVVHRTQPGATTRGISRCLMRSQRCCGKAHALCKAAAMPRALQSSPPAASPACREPSACAAPLCRAGPATQSANQPCLPRTCAGAPPLCRAGPQPHMLQTTGSHASGCGAPVQAHKLSVNMHGGAASGQAQHAGPTCNGGSRAGLGGKPRGYATLIGWCIAGCG
jgi:hypothetical protein